MSDYVPKHLATSQKLTYDSSSARTAPDSEAGFIDIIVMLLSAVVLAFLLRAFVVESYEVPSGSMLETIQIGDRLIGEKISYRFGEPQVGDVVTFSFVNDEGKREILVKRVIATAGQTVSLSDDGHVIIDGSVMDEPYTQNKPSRPLPGGVSFPYEVPDGYIWVMGDNRTNSNDSRVFGAIPLSDVTSHVIFTFWPPSSFGTLE